MCVLPKGIEVLQEEKRRGPSLQALKQGLDRLYGARKQAFTFCEEKFPNLHNTFLASAYGDTVATDGANIKDWAEIVLIANTKWKV